MNTDEENKILKDGPLVSVLMECFNYEEFVGRSIQSVLDQTYSNFELIIVDDCSSDSSYEIINSFNDSRIRAYRNKVNRGHIQTRNDSLKKIQGDIVAFLDADDVWMPDKLSIQVSFLMKNPKYIGSFTNAIFIDENDHEYTNSYDLRGPIDLYRTSSISNPEIIYKFFKQGNFLAHTSAVVRKNSIDRLGHFNVSLSHVFDYEYWTRLVLLGDVYIHPEILLNVRRRMDNPKNVSLLNEDTVPRLINESVFVMYSLFKNMDKVLFSDAFKDELQFEIDDEIDLICEKYLVLLNWFCQGINNKMPAMLILFEYISNNIFIDRLETKFNVSIKDIYKETSYYITMYPGLSQKQFKDMNDLRNLSEQRDSIIKSMLGSISWKVTKPLRLILKIFNLV